MELTENTDKFNKIREDIETLRKNEIKYLYEEIRILGNAKENDLQNIYLEKALNRIYFISKYDLEEKETLNLIKDITNINRTVISENLKKLYSKEDYQKLEEKTKEDYLSIFKANNNIKKMTKEKMEGFDKIYEKHYKKELVENALIKNELKEFGLEQNLKHYEEINSSSKDYETLEKLMLSCDKEHFQSLNNGSYNNIAIKYLQQSGKYEEIDRLYKDFKINEIKEEFIGRLNNNTLDKQFIDELNDRVNKGFHKNFNENIRNTPNTREELLNQIVKDIEKGTPKWRNGVTQKPFQMSYNYVTKRAYNGINAIQLSFSELGQKDPRWMTFNNARELGMKIKPDEKGTKVFAFRLYDTQEKKDLNLEEYNNMTREQQKEKDKYIKPINQTWVLFNGTQIDGMPPLSQGKTFEHDLNKIEEKLIKDSLAPISFDGEGKNYYRASTDSIHLTDKKHFENKEEFISTMIHEISHSTGHESRLNRDMTGGYGTEKYAREELVAELTTVFAMGELGLRTDPKVFENNKAYLGHWAKSISENPKIINEAFKEASKSCDLIKDKILELGKEKKQEKSLSR